MLDSLIKQVFQCKTPDVILDEKKIRSGKYALKRIRDFVDQKILTVQYISIMII